MSVTCCEEAWPSGNDERKTVIQTAVICLGRVGQMADKGDPPKVHAQTHPHIYTQEEMLCQSHTA